MPHIDLRVPFKDKDAAKRQGARWDAARRTWFLPEGVPEAPFAQWLAPPPTINVRAASYCIAESRRLCWVCAGDTAVFGYAVPRGHEIRAELSEDLEFESDEAYEVWRALPQSMGWIAQATASMLEYIVYLPDNLQARMASITDTYRIDFSNMTHTFYWMNHCQLCGNKQGDFELIEEFDAPLRPLYPESASAVILRSFSEPLEAESQTATLREGIIGFMQAAVGR